MSERKVSLRVSAVGGDKLKAELRSIGKEGQHALSMLETGGPGASRGLTATGHAADLLMDRLTALSMKAAQAANSMKVVETSGTSVLARVNRATGVTGRVARDGEDIAAYGRALDDLRAKMNPLFAEMQRHEGAISEIDSAWRVGAITLDEWVSATRREEAANKDAATAIRLRQAAFENFVNTGLRDAINEITGVSGALARTSEDMEAFGRAMDDARARFSPLYAEQRRHADAMGEMQRLYRAGILAEDEFVAATQREVAAHAEAASAIRQRQAALANMVNTSLRDSINTSTGVSAMPARSAEDIAAYGRALDETRAKYNPMFAAIQRYRSELAQVKAAHAAGAISAEEMTAAMSRLRQASLRDIGVIKGRIHGYQAMEKAGGLARFQMVQLGYQLNDIGVSLASGQNPLIVMIQQGAQIAQIYGGQGGVRAMFGQIGQLITKLPGPLKVAGIAVGVAALGVAGLQHEINKVSDVTVSFGDTALAVWQVVSEGVWQWIKPAADKIGEWFGVAWDYVVAGVKIVGNVTVNTFRTVFSFLGSAVGIMAGEWKRIAGIAKAAYDGVVAVWGALPAAIGDFAYGAANALIEGVESMLNAVVDRINKFVGMLNNALAMLPEWATGEGGIKIGEIGNVSLGGIENPYAGAAAKAGQGFADAMAEITAAAAQENDAWSDFMSEAGDIWASDPLGDFFDAVSARAQENAKKRKAEEKKGGGGRGGAGGNAKKEDDVLGFLDKIKKALADYAQAAMDLGQQIGDALVGAFKSAEDALVEFVETGKLDIKSLASSIIADFARIGIRSYIMGPLANALGGMIGGPFGDALTKAFVQHTGGAAGSGPMRTVSAANFVSAPRLHSGMGDLRADEYAAILQRGERVLNRRETRDYESGRFGMAAPVININGVRDVQSFRQSRTQVAADLSRAMGMARRAS